MKWFVKPILLGLAEAVGIGLLLLGLIYLAAWIFMRGFSNL
jgi:hypothetical protein